MKLSASKALVKAKPKVQRLIEILKKDYEYVSVLATDCTGDQFVYAQRNKSVSGYNFAERGFVLRAYKNEGYMEYSFNEIENPEALAEKIKKALAAQEETLSDLKVEKYETPLLYEEKITQEFLKEDYESCYETSKEEIMEKLQAISDKGVSYKDVIETSASYSHVTINKMFISEQKDLIQAYSYSLTSFAMLAFANGKTFYNYHSGSGFKGVEIIDENAVYMDEVYNDLISLFDAPHIEPGEYEVICTPEASGMIAHEAFGHGLEMDMFVKNRAVAKEKMGEKLGSDLCCMYDGTTEFDDTASYSFDDEGVISGLTTILKNGYLVNGMTDVLSALRLNVTPSGNGRRESFERKAYTRMTNTYFGGGNNTLEEMIESIKYGFLIDSSSNGMEDPKHWGIQCVYNIAKEIKDGKLTGKVFTPVYLTGYVPDLLANISMATPVVSTNGNGFCGKGYKEWVVVSDGGPYIKTKVRLG